MVTNPHSTRSLGQVSGKLPGGKVLGGASQQQLNMSQPCQEAQGHPWAVSAAGQ